MMLLEKLKVILLFKNLLGWYEDEVFHVNAFGFPPTEPSATTRYKTDFRQPHSIFCYGFLSKRIIIL